MRMMKFLLKTILISSIVFGCNIHPNNTDNPIPSNTLLSPSAFQGVINDCKDEECSLISTPGVKLFDLICNSEKYTLINVEIYDENQLSTKDFTINLQLLDNKKFCDGSKEFKTLSSVPYTLFKVTTGMYIYFTITKFGYTTRKHDFIPLCGQYKCINNILFGWPDSKKEIYGDLGKKYFISTRPETTPLTPVYNSKDVSLNTPIKLIFSEPVDKKTVEDNFIIKVSDVGDSNLKAGDIIFTGSDYNITWNNDDTEATFTPKDGKLLPTSKTPPKYAIAFKTPFKDKDGNLANDKNGYFRIEPDNYMESYFTVISSSPSVSPSAGSK